MTPIRLIVGLGNPGTRYSGTRHNAGALFLRQFVDRRGIVLRPNARVHGATAEILVGGGRVRLLAPGTWMNESGRAVRAMLDYFKIPAAAMLVAHDELDLPAGVVRLKSGGGSGGHNGIRDVQRALGDAASFARLRFGIGHPGPGADVVGYVLSKAPVAERRLLQETIDAALDELDHIVSGRWDLAMNRLHALGALEAGA